MARPEHRMQLVRASRTLARVSCAAVLLTLACASSAQAAVRLSVSPPTMQVRGSAGETLREPITVSAPGDAITVELVHADFGFTDAGYELQLIPDEAEETTAFSTRGWFSLPKPRYRIPAGRSVEVPLRIAIPSNTPAGTYLGAALLRVTSNADADPTSQVRTIPQAGPLVFVAVEGGDPPKPAIRSFQVPGRVSDGPIRPRIVVENQGDEYFTYSGTIKLRGPGRDDTVEIARQFVVPGQPRTVRTSPDELGKQGQPILGTRTLGFGKYEVEARLRIEPTGTTIVSTRTVWVIPTWLRLLAVGIAVLLAVCIALLVRWVLDRRRAAAQATTPPDRRPGDDEDDAELEDSGDEFDAADRDDEDPYLS